MTDTNATLTPSATPEFEPSTAEQQAPSDPPANWVLWAVVVLSIASGGAGWLAWNTQKKVQSLEQELVRRQSDSQRQSVEARLLASQAQDLSREAAARTTLLETRLAEVALQRTQIEDLIKTLSLSRDENLVSDIEASLRVASQQAALTGSAEPLVVAMQSADDRLTRTHQPRLDNVRRALAKDLDRVRSTRVADLSSLTIRLDEAARLIDEVPLLNQPETVLPTPSRSTPSKGKSSAAASAPTPASRDTGEPSWGSHVLGWSKGAAQTIWDETRGLIRLTRIARPEAMLIAPDQAFFLRENIKLRLLNARLALLSRQTAVAVADLQAIQSVVPRYFDLQSRKTQLLQSMLADVTTQSQQTAVPRPDDTLAALATVSGGR
ncbi:MAG: uroporphyrinogen-III C-methyltransferase [Aquabacterium sp.]|nr:uroporphyrinogen-III C-methyltransferase [Aquabacterium sp.]